jgi:glycosyltransferase involved in cell wall biosynthesis
MAKRLRSLMKAHQPHIVLTYNWGALDGAVAALTGLRVPTIHTEDGFGIDEAVHQKHRRVMMRRMILRHVSHVVAPSRVLLRIMREQWAVPEDKLLYIANGIDSNVFKPPAAAIERKHLVIGTVAQLRPEKMMDVLLRVFAQVNGSDVLLHIAGDGPEKESLQQLAGALGISSRVRFFGNVDRIAEFYCELDIFALTSSTEQMPYSVLEAAAAGLPIVSTDVGDVKEMVSPENRHFVVQQNALASSLTTLLGDADLRNVLGASNREHCRRHYELHRMLHTYEALYLKLCEKTEVSR